MDRCWVWILPITLCVHVFLQALSNDSKQDAFHTRSVLNETYKRFLHNHPWLNKERGGILQSDNAPNYREPTYELDQVSMGELCATMS